MGEQNLKEILVEVIKATETLRRLIQVDEYETVSSTITLKGYETGTLKTINITIDKENSVTVEGDAPYMEIFKKAVKDYMEEF